jgi:cyclophilin family peptidyl-prolyl cis-trans isomerase
MRHAVITVLLFAGFFLASCDRPAPPKKQSPYATMETDYGTIEIELLPSIAPKTVTNFRLLAERGYYNGLTFHRIVKDLIIQGGDPLGTGMGGESAWGGKFEDEIDRKSAFYRDGYKRGTVAMANSGANTNTSQFFIVRNDYRLGPGYTIFGRVTKGIEVIDAMAETPCEKGPDGRMTKPIKPPVMKKVTIRVSDASGLEPQP